VPRGQEGAPVDLPNVMSVRGDTANSVSNTGRAPMRLRRSTLEASDRCLLERRRRQDLEIARLTGKLEAEKARAEFLQKAVNRENEIDQFLRIPNHDNKMKLRRTGVRMQRFEMQELVG
jgi:hypothetical protein